MKEEKKKGLSNLKAVGYGTGAATAATALISAPVTNNFMKTFNHHDDVKHEDIKKIVNEVHPNGEVKLHTPEEFEKRINKKSPHAAGLRGMSRSNSFFLPKNVITKNMVHFKDHEHGMIVHGLEHHRSSGSILAHEIGHSDKRNIIGKTLGKAHMFGNPLAHMIPLAAITGTYAAKRGYHGKEEFKKEHPHLKKGLEIAGGVGAVGGAAVLAEEARASIKARKYLKSIGKKPKGLIPAYLTYAAKHAIIPAAAGGLGYLGGKRLKNKENSLEKKAFKEEGLYAFPEYKRVMKKYNGGDLENDRDFKLYERALRRAKFRYEASRR